MDYRFYLLLAGQIRAGESFSAHDDAAATKTAALLYEACSDIFDGCELWRNDHRIANLTALNYFCPVTLEEISPAAQENLLDLEYRLERTFSAIRTSRKLGSLSAKLRDRLGAARDSHPLTPMESGAPKRT